MASETYLGLNSRDEQVLAMLPEPANAIPGLVSWT
jgi:hypothetical protein